ncbi:hypothetical protein CDD83_6820 [Cordyceps sp. RAO-2017]|nr:hypothetical protein CDD83_6820 [Cordyceps sp. RAO-2017]
MPPRVPRKRLRESPPPPPPPPPKPSRRAKAKAKGEAKSAHSTPASSTRRKATLFDDLDATATPLSSKDPASIAPGFDHPDSESSLTSLSDQDFEDLPPAKRQKAAREPGGGGGDDDDDDDEVEFEDVEAPGVDAPDAPVVSGDLELTLTQDTRVSLTNPFGDKKGPSKRERKVRSATHCVHVMLLLWHNAVRNAWLCDPETQAIMMSHLPPRMWDEIDRWRRSSGLNGPPEKQGKGKGGRRGRDAGGEGKSPKSPSRDWGRAAQRLEEGVVDMSHGDPLFRLMQSLVSWWKQRFRVTAPGLRKRGYMALERLDRLTKAHAAEQADAARFGERIPSLEAFRWCAQACRGSRDVGAQLFVSLLRGLGLEARMVANLPCLGFGWNKLEDAEPEKGGGPSGSPAKGKRAPAEAASSKQSSRGAGPAKDKAGPPETPRQTRSSGRTKPEDKGGQDELRLERSDSDDESVVEVRTTPRRTQPAEERPDQDLEYPHYWVEVLSPVSNNFVPVDPIVKGTIATNRDLVESFEPRGAKADRARQVMAYIVGYSQDGTAKDVTVRYLKRRIMPGRTRGARMAPEKVPVYDRHGKVKRHEQYDWFKAALSGYRRGDRARPLTEADREEDATDLAPAKAEKKEVKEGEETVQFYKQSKEFVLARHLKREEALGPAAKPVKVFRNKVRGGRVEEEDVYLRADVVNVKSAETWHKQGRAPLPGERPLKRVPYRAATLNRRREILEAEAATGEKVLQGLFSREQTDWIIPPPIRDGVIPKNDYGNIDLFAEHMCPEGAVHVPYRGAVRVCKRLQIDYAEAVVDFEFGHRMAVPVIQGVVVAEEHHGRLMQELERDEAERARKEDEKRRKAALGKWRKFMMGLRIVERIRQDYGEVDDGVSVFGHRRAGPAQEAGPGDDGHGDDTAGGFLPEGYEEEGQEGDQHTSSFFPGGGGDDDDDDEEADDGDLIMEDDRRGPSVAAAAAEGGKADEGGGESGDESEGEKRRTARRRQR